MLLPLVDLAGIPVLVFVLIVSVTMHEAAHAWAAELLGDPTAAQHGRLSFNPLVHLDRLGTVIFPFVSFLSGFSFVGWGRPIPVRIEELGAGWRSRLLLIAAAGPVASFVVALAAAGLLRAGAAASGAPTDALVGPLLLRAVELNIVLVLLNLVPIPPLDASVLFAVLRPAGAAASFDRLRTGGIVVLVLLTITGALPALLVPARASIASVLL